MGLENLTEEEKELLDKLIAKVEGPEELKPGDTYFSEELGRYTVMSNPGPPNIQRTLDPTDWTERQIRGMEATGYENYLKGVANPKKSPRDASIAGHDKYVAKMKDPTVLERQKTNRAKVPDEEWLGMCESIGADKLVAGTVARKHKILNFTTKYVPLLRGHLATIDAMPDATDAQREAKVLANMRGLKKLKGKAK